MITNNDIKSAIIKTIKDVIDFRKSEDSEYSEGYVNGIAALAYQLGFITKEIIEKITEETGFKFYID